MVNEVLLPQLQWLTIAGEDRSLAKEHAQDPKHDVNPKKFAQCCSGKVRINSI
jgi:hypothetical protein